MKTKIRDFLFVYILNCVALNFLPVRNGLGFILLIIVNIIIFAQLSLARRKDDSTTNCHTDKNS